MARALAVYRNVDMALNVLH